MKRRKEDDLAPSPQFLAHAKTRSRLRKQRDQLMDDLEMVRLIGIQASRGEGDAAHRTLDELLSNRRGAVRYSDIHLKDVGMSERAVRYLAEESIHTVSDLAHQDAVKFCTRFSALDALTITLTTLRRIIELERERS